MTEVRLTEPVRATYLKNDADLRSTDESVSPKGCFTYDGDFITYKCPCGCGSIGTLRADLNQKPADTPSWIFDGNYAQPTLTPSVHHVGHWHGWLRNGWWEQA
jgi:hypothetical protein